MNTGRETPGRHDCNVDAAAYVLGALTTEEGEAFRRHLSTCVVCRDEVAALKTVGDALALAAPQLPAPRRLRRRVRADIRREPNGGTTTAGARARLAPSAAAVGAAVGLAGVIVAIIVLASGGSSESRTIRASVAPPAASAVVRVAGGHAELIVLHMPPPPAGKIYEVWLERDGRNPTPTTALFDVTSAGAGAVDIPGDLSGVGEVLVTPERLGGSLAPTHAPVIVARLV